jgi:hypothetical protein
MAINDYKRKRKKKVVWVYLTDWLVLSWLIQPTLNLLMGIWDKERKKGRYDAVVSIHLYLFSIFTILHGYTIASLYKIHEYCLVDVFLYSILQSIVMDRVKASKIEWLNKKVNNHSSIHWFKLFSILFILIDWLIHLTHDYKWIHFHHQSSLYISLLSIFSFPKKYYINS